MEKYHKNDYRYQFFGEKNKEYYRIFTWLVEEERDIFWVECSQCKKVIFKYGTYGRGRDIIRSKMEEHYKEFHQDFLVMGLLIGGWNWQGGE